MVVVATTLSSSGSGGELSLSVCVAVSVPVAVVVIPLLPSSSGTRRLWSIDIGVVVGSSTGGASVMMVTMALIPSLGSIGRLVVSSL